MFDELLGSTTGEPGALFRLAKRPIIENSLVLRVREDLGVDERETLLATQGPDAVRSDVADIPGSWVRWYEIESLVEADPEARVFMLDRRTGAIRFGNGRQGRIPPAGSDSVRAFSYQSGGGQRGNVPAYSVTSLKSAVTGVEAVINPLAARGGSDGRQDSAGGAHAAARLRHRGRALSSSDIEALTLDFAPEIVRARCLRPADPGDPIEIVVALASAERMPEPDLAMRDGLSRFLYNAASSSMMSSSFKVTGPGFRRVRIRLVLKPSSTSPASLVAEVRTRLLSFLHPTTGGPGRRGWPFGRRLWPSDVHLALRDVLGDSQVDDLSIDHDVTTGDRGGSMTTLVTMLEDDLDIKLITRHEGSVA